MGFAEELFSVMGFAEDLSPVPCQFCYCLNTHVVPCQKKGGNDTHQHYACDGCGLVFTKYEAKTVPICIGPPGYKSNPKTPHGR